MVDMPEITIKIPDDIFKEMKNFSDVDWSEVCINAIKAKLYGLKVAKKVEEMLKGKTFAELSEKEKRRIIFKILRESESET